MNVGYIIYGVVPPIILLFCFGERFYKVLPVGSMIMLVDPVNKLRMQSRLIGWDEGGCLMLEQPTRGGSAVQLTKDLHLVGRGMYEGRVWGFKSNVLFQTVQPFRILFLVYPDQIEEISLRKMIGFR